MAMPRSAFDAQPYRGLVHSGDTLPSDEACWNVLDFIAPAELRIDLRAVVGRPNHRRSVSGWQTGFDSGHAQETRRTALLGGGSANSLSTRFSTGTHRKSPYDRATE